MKSGLGLVRRRRCRSREREERREDGRRTKSEYRRKDVIKLLVDGHMGSRGPREEVPWKGIVTLSRKVPYRPQG